MYLLFDEMAETQRRKDEFDAIQRQRVERQLLIQQGALTRRHVLANLGTHMVQWGTWLQQRFDTLSAQAANGYTTNEKASPCP